jgi:CRP-like cAMP-binding protein
MTPVNDRTVEQCFYMRMHLKCEVSIFYDYDRHTLENLTKVMRQKVFDRNEIIFSKGDPPTDMFIVLMGEVGLYSEKKCISVATENHTFGDKALDSMELRDRTAIAHKVTVCLTLNKLDYEEKTYIVED